MTIIERRIPPLARRQPSITYWNRIEPSPRTKELAKPLAATVADGLWNLTRQWQLGEFRGEDCGSPAWLEVDSTSTRMDAWTVEGTLHPLELHVPLDKAIAATLPFDLETSVEFGQAFEQMLSDDGRAVHIAAFRAAFPIVEAAPGETNVKIVRLRRVTAGRATDGAALWSAAIASLPSLPITISASEEPAVTTLLQSYVALVRDFFGGDPELETQAWDASRLAYTFATTTGEAGDYIVRPRGNGEPSWEAFSSAGLLLPPPDPAPPETQKITLLPASVRFRGMAPSRCWDIESATMDAGAIDVERRDLGKLLFVDVMLMQPRDWYVIPIEQQVGTLMRLDAVLVRDVFGLLTVIHPANDSAWSMFHISGALNDAGSLLPDIAGASALHGKAREEVRFIRDEMLNMVWSVVETNDRESALPIAPPPLPRYRLRRDPVGPWSAFVPVGSLDGVMLERVDGSAAPLRIAEEELRRSGLRIVRVPIRSRGADGRTHVWIGRIRTHGPHEASNGIRFDLLDRGDAG